MKPFKLTLKFTLTLILLSNICLGQLIVLKGSVKGVNDEKLEYVNIGIKSKGIGTISDKNGHFSIRINKENESDSLTFSFLGYKELTIKVSEIIKNAMNEFILEEEFIPLDEVVITSKKTRKKTLGTSSYLRFVVGDVRVNNNQNNDIQEFAKKLNIKKPSKVLEVSIALSNININSAKFRVNFYTIKNNIPFKKIGSKNIILEKSIVKGWNKFDLKKFDLQFEKPVFISIEYLPTRYNEQEPFRYNGQLFGRSIKRSSSLGNWSVTKGAKIAMYVTVRQ